MIVGDREFKGPEDLVDRGTYHEVVRALALSIVYKRQAIGTAVYDLAKLKYEKEKMNLDVGACTLAILVENSQDA